MLKLFAGMSLDTSRAIECSTQEASIWLIVAYLIAFIFLVASILILIKTKSKPIKIISISTMIAALLYCTYLTFSSFFASSTPALGNPFEYSISECREAREKSAEGKEKCADEPIDEYGVPCEF